MVDRGSVRSGAGLTTLPMGPNMRVIGMLWPLRDSLYRTKVSTCSVAEIGDDGCNQIFLAAPGSGLKIYLADWGEILTVV